MSNPKRNTAVTIETAITKSEWLITTFLVGQTTCLSSALTDFK
ncbi:MAG: hypothetical protein VB008_02000 [Candidatus Elulimicrobiales bacterium]|nr:hypothetical protein [Candidatus Elulimicrobiales bacterium]